MILHLQATKLIADVPVYPGIIDINILTLSILYTMSYYHTWVSRDLLLFLCSGTFGNLSTLSSLELSISL